MTKTDHRDRLDELLAAAIADPNRRYAFYRSFLEHELVVIGTVSNDESNIVLKYIEYEGKLVLLVYTSWDKFNAIYQAQYPYVKIPARMLLDAAEPTHPWMLNPGFAPSKLLIPEELRTLKDGTILDYYWEQLIAPDKTRMLEEQITEISEQSLLELTQCLQAFPSIRAAYLARIFKPSANDIPFPMIGLEMDIEDREAARLQIQVLYETVKRQTRLDPPCEFFLLDDAVTLTQSMKEHLEPFYVRTHEDDIRSLFQ